MMNKEKSQGKFSISSASLSAKLEWLDETFCKSNIPFYFDHTNSSMNGIIENLLGCLYSSWNLPNDTASFTSPVKPDFFKDYSDVDFENLSDLDKVIEWSLLMLWLYARSIPYQVVGKCEFISEGSVPFYVSLLKKVDGYNLLFSFFKRQDLSKYKEKLAVILLCSYAGCAMPKPVQCIFSTIIHTIVTNTANFFNQYDPYNRLQDLLEHIKGFVADNTFSDGRALAFVKAGLVQVLMPFMNPSKTSTPVRMTASLSADRRISYYAKDILISLLKQQKGADDVKMEFASSRFFESAIEVLERHHVGLPATDILNVLELLTHNNATASAITAQTIAHRAVSTALIHVLFSLLETEDFAEFIAHRMDPKLQLESELAFIHGGKKTLKDFKEKADFLNILKVLRNIALAGLNSRDEGEEDEDEKDNKEDSKNSSPRARNAFVKSFVNYTTRREGIETLLEYLKMLKKTSASHPAETREYQEVLSVCIRALMEGDPSLNMRCHGDAVLHVYKAKEWARMGVTVQEIQASLEMDGGPQLIPTKKLAENFWLENMERATEARWVWKGMVNAGEVVNAIGMAERGKKILSFVGLLLLLGAFCFFKFF